VTAFLFATHGHVADLVHTEVPPALRGRHLGEALVDYAVADAGLGLAAHRDLPVCARICERKTRRPDGGLGMVDTEEIWSRRSDLNR
jgi:predicted GNAT family acetyltransferase